MAPDKTKKRRTSCAECRRQPFQSPERTSEQTTKFAPRAWARFGNFTKLVDETGQAAKPLCSTGNAKIMKRMSGNKRAMAFSFTPKL